MTFNKISSVFIDLDDTLWDFSRNSEISLRHVFDVFEINKFTNYDTFADIYHKKNIELWHLYHYGKISKDFLITERFRFTLQQLNINDDCDKLADVMNTEYLDYLSSQPYLIDGATNLLEYLSSKGYKIHILSNGFTNTQIKKLQSSHIEHYISQLIVSDDCGITKPLRGIFDFALQKCEANAQYSVMIGDNADADIRGAYEAGWHTIYFNKNGEKEQSALAEFTVTHLNEIENIL